MDELGEITRRKGITRYHQLHALLAVALSEGYIASGSALPSEAELMRRFQLSRNTVRRALAQLESERRIVRRRGSGTYARSAPRQAFSPDAIAEVLHDADAARAQTASRLLRVQASPTPVFIRRRDPSFGDRSLMVQRCRSFKNEPFMLSTSHVPERLAGRLTRRRLGRQAVLAALDEIGIVPDRAEQITTAVAANTVSAKYLRVDPASPLLCVHRLVRDREGRSIEHHSYLYRPDRCYMRVSVAFERSAAGLQWSNTQLSSDIPAWL